MLNPDDNHDGALLKAYVEKCDERAFEIVLKRHANLVYSQCRRVLQRDDDIGDAVQAVYITLARKAGTLKHEKSVGPWLFHVSRCIACDALRARTVREKREKRIEVDRMVQTENLSPATLDLLFRELDALPERYSRPIVLFHLEGKTLIETAQALGCNTNTAGSRLMRGRERLKRKLERRGVLLSGILLASLLSAESGAAEIPATQLDELANSVHRALHTGTQPVMTRAESLAEGVLRKMFIHKLTTAAAIAISVGALSALVGWSSFSAVAQDAPVATLAPEKTPEKKIIVTQSSVANAAAGKVVLSEVERGTITALAKENNLSETLTAELLASAREIDGKLHVSCGADTASMKVVFESVISRVSEGESRKLASENLVAQIAKQSGITLEQAEELAKNSFTTAYATGNEIVDGVNVESGTPRLMISSTDITPDRIKTLNSAVESLRLKTQSHIDKYKADYAELERRNDKDKAVKLETLKNEFEKDFEALRVESTQIKKLFTSQLNAVQRKAIEEMGRAAEDKAKQESERKQPKKETPPGEF